MRGIPAGHAVVVLVCGVEGQGAAASSNRGVRLSSETQSSMDRLWSDRKKRSVRIRRRRISVGMPWNVSGGGSFPLVLAAGVPHDLAPQEEGVTAHRIAARGACGVTTTYDYLLNRRDRSSWGRGRCRAWRGTPGRRGPRSHRAGNAPGRTFPMSPARLHPTRAARGRR